MLLRRRGWGGKISFDHDNQRLLFDVRPNGTSEAHASSAKRAKTDSRSMLKELSGGERSATMSALLMALADAMDVPFRAFDEFEVFMDDAARQLAYKTMITTCMDYPTRQFMFLTPLNIASINQNDKGFAKILAENPNAGLDIRKIELRPPALQ